MGGQVVVMSDLRVSDNYCSRSCRSALGASASSEGHTRDEGELRFDDG